MDLPDWNNLSDDERVKLVKVVEFYNWPPGSDGQFALDFYNELRRILRDHKANLPMTA